MRIVDEQSMNEFCDLVNSSKTIAGIQISYIDDFTVAEVSAMEACNAELIQEGLLGKGSHLMQGITRLEYDDETKKVSIGKRPYLYPSQKVLEEYPGLTGPMTGNLQCCVDFENDSFLYHMRGDGISRPFGFQAASAGMQDFYTTLYEESVKELSEEAGIFTARPLFRENAVSILPFMKGKQIPQPLFTYVFEADLSDFPKYNSVEEVEEFEARTKKALEDGDLQNQEGFQFAVPIGFAYDFAKHIEATGRQYGPIRQSVEDTLDLLD